MALTNDHYSRGDSFMFKPIKVSPREDIVCGTHTHRKLAFGPHSCSPCAATCFASSSPLPRRTLCDVLSVEFQMPLAHTTTTTSISYLLQVMGTSARRIGLNRSDDERLLFGVDGAAVWHYCESRRAPLPGVHTPLFFSRCRPSTSGGREDTKTCRTHHPV